MIGVFFFSGSHYFITSSALPLSSIPRLRRLRPTNVVTTRGGRIFLGGRGSCKLSYWNFIQVAFLLRSNYADPVFSGEVFNPSPLSPVITRNIVPASKRARPIVTEIAIVGHPGTAANESHRP